MNVLIDRAAEETPATRRPQKRGNALTKKPRLPAIDAYIAERLTAPLPVIPTVPFSPDAVNRFFRRWVQLTSH